MWSRPSPRSRLTTIRCSEAAPCQPPGRVEPVPQRAASPLRAARVCTCVRTRAPVPVSRRGSSPPSPRAGPPAPNYPPRRTTPASGSGSARASRRHPAARAMPRSAPQKRRRSSARTCRRCRAIRRVSPRRGLPDHALHPTRRHRRHALRFRDVQQLVAAARFHVGLRRRARAADTPVSISASARIRSRRAAEAFPARRAHPSNDPASANAPVDLAQHLLRHARRANRACRIPRCECRRARCQRAARMRPHGRHRRRGRAEQDESRHPHREGSTPGTKDCSGLPLRLGRERGAHRGPRRDAREVFAGCAGSLSRFTTSGARSSNGPQHREGIDVRNGIVEDPASQGPSPASPRRATRETSRRSRARGEDLRRIGSVEQRAPAEASFDRVRSSAIFASTLARFSRQARREILGATEHRAPVRRGGRREIAPRHARGRDRKARSGSSGSPGKVSARYSSMKNEFEISVPSWSSSGPSRSRCKCASTSHRDSPSENCSKCLRSRTSAGREAGVLLVQRDQRLQEKCVGFRGVELKHGRCAPGISRAGPIAVRPSAQIFRVAGPLVDAAQPFHDARCLRVVAVIRDATAAARNRD